MSKEAMQMALDALEYCDGYNGHIDVSEEIEALRAELSQPEPEPVAWLYTSKLGGRQVSLLEPLPNFAEQYQPLYSIPPQANNFNPDWDAIPVMVEELQRMVKRIEELESQLGEAMWGYSEWRRKAEISSALCTRQSIRLMEYESQEPVAYGVLAEDGQIDWACDYPFSNESGWPDSVPLYTAPPQRKPLTITEAAKLWEESHCALPRYHTFRLLIEAAHGIGEEL